MQKTVEIDGKNVKFESKGSTPLRYKKQFGSDYFVDIMKLGQLEKISKNPSYEELKALDTEVFYHIIWVLAKTAKPDIPEPFEWLDEFNEFPLLEIIPEIQELISSSLQSKKK
ncbi:hypothetical protein SFC50_25830 [Bacillus infantis]|uniref:hypothetical protein n=1 Tax=Bacillus infantis TaxID=324767 RepID=UPI003981F811